MPLYSEALPAHGQPAAGPPPGWQYMVPAHPPAAPAQKQDSSPPPGWQYMVPAHQPAVQAQPGGANIKMENLIFVSIFLVFLALLHAAAGSRVTYYLLWVILAGVVISRWPKINSFLRRYIA